MCVFGLSVNVVGVVFMLLFFAYLYLLLVYSMHGLRTYVSVSSLVHFYKSSPRSVTPKP